MGHITLNQPPPIPVPLPPPPYVYDQDHPVLDANIMQLVYSLYCAQLQLQQAHAALNNVEQTLHHAALSDQSLMSTSHFAYDALCQVLSISSSSSSTPGTSNGAASPNLAHPLTLSTAIRPDHIDYDLFQSKFRNAFPGSDHLFPPSHPNLSTSGATTNAGTATRFPHPPPLPGMNQNNNNNWGTPGPPMDPQDPSNPSSSYFNNAHNRRPYLPAPQSSSAMSFPSFPPPHLPPLHYPQKSPHHLPPINPLSLIVAAAASEESAARSTIPTPTSPPPGSANGRQEHDLPWAARRGSYPNSTAPASSHWNAQLLLRASDVAEDQARERRKSMQMNDDEDEDAEGEDDEELEEQINEIKKPVGKPRKRGRGDNDEGASAYQRPSAGGRDGSRRKKKRSQGAGADSDDDDDDDDEEEYNNDDEDDDDDEEDWVSGQRASSSKASHHKSSRSSRASGGGTGTPRGSKRANGGGSKTGSGADDGDSGSKGKARRQPRSMEFDPRASYPLNHDHHFLLVQTKPSQPELSDRCCTELFLATNLCSPTAPLARVLSGMDKAYTPSHYAEDIRLASSYTFTSATGTSWIVSYLPRGSGGPTVTAASPTPTSTLIIGPPTTNTFVHLPPGSFVVNESPASPIGSLPWWRVQACVGATKHRGMPGPEGAWTARYDKDPRDRRPARILEHFAKCRWRQGEGEGAGAGGGDAIGRLARAVLGGVEK